MYLCTYTERGKGREGEREGGSSCRDPSSQDSPAFDEEAPLVWVLLDSRKGSLKGLRVCGFETFPASLKTFKFLLTKIYSRSQKVETSLSSCPEK